MSETKPPAAAAVVISYHTRYSIFFIADKAWSNATINHRTHEEWEHNRQSANNDKNYYTYDLAIDSD